MDCNWCKQGQCWTHGVGAKGGATGVIQTNVEQASQSSQESEMEELMALMVQQVADDCNWCKQGQCWTHGKGKGKGAKGGAKDVIQTNTEQATQRSPGSQMKEFMALMVQQVAQRNQYGPAMTPIQPATSPYQLVNAAPKPIQAVTKQAFDCQWCQQGGCWTHQGQNQPAQSQFYKYDSGAVKSAIENVMPATKEEVAAFLTGIIVDEKSKARMVRLSLKLQKLVICMGPMDISRDQSRALISRVNRVRKIAKGDWVCFACNDIQESTNTKCKRCSFEKC